MALLDEAAAWRDADPDPQTKAELDQLIRDAQSPDPGRSAEALSELTDAFRGPLEFGTAGLRGKLGPGPNRMNRVVVIRAAAGFARWLRAQGSIGRVIVGYDARHKSADFARDTAEVFAGAGFDVLLTDEPTPTPVVAFGIQHFGCVAGVVVTASHNPPADNGYKVYLGDGSQIIPPTDAQIAAEIATVAASGQPPAVSEARTIVGDELREAYVNRLAEVIGPDAPKELRWVHTSMHGVGARLIRQAARRLGFPKPVEVAEQSAPDPDFPTVAFPNPEEPGAIDLALALARHEDADVVIANDPDADRCAVAAKVDGRWRMLSGDELGAILGYDALRRQVPGTFANSIVSSTLLRTMASAAGREHRTTLTGFKWIGRVPDLAFGYEEAIGYCCDSRAVPDKDGISAAMTVLRIVAELKREGRELADLLDEIARRFGLHATSQLSVRVADLGIIAGAMDRLRSAPPAELLGEPVVVSDLAEGKEGLPPTNGIELTGERVHVVARPSGTEPKLKCYLEVRLPRTDDVSVARAEGGELLSRLRAEMADALGIAD
ncbi:phospho-sugar mutase [Tessaracoccus sp. OH4464_COT-324]|uniref:phospho-sugar mutase n=1 Tax=Tessaracoccus sp. OH4464_COT-324 TaxID=2491059 RepID=UPI000F63384D|nr:phospho-sugar mutase [Tessaracoccus sp. OH4464_COT-324]RRD44752.1 phospho-sugar mutase [Tessaracoccus sp. OH4464_COT-324]